jgi:protein-tyrosine phosphatase
MSGFVDLHCHLLPALDDGPADDAHAVALARALVADGVTTVAATPHRTAQFATALPDLFRRLAVLRALLDANDVALEVLSGSEVAVEALIDMDPAEVQALRLGGTGPLLVELPLGPGVGDPTWPIHQLLDDGIPVLVAHPERIPLIQQDPEVLRALVERGAHAQVTSGALIGRYGRTAQACAVGMIDAGLIDVIASDAHHYERRPPETTAALQWLRQARPNVDGAALAVHTPAVLIPPQAPVT